MLWWDAASVHCAEFARLLPDGVLDTDDTFYYQEISQLGSGLSGTVQRCRDLRSGQDVALKCLGAKSLDEPGSRERARKEITIYSRLKHKHIVELKRVFCHQNRIFIVMDVANGGELFKVVVGSITGLSEPVAAYFFRHMVEAVRHCHRHGIVHRDLKPENFLLTEKWSIRLCDFGFSSNVDEERPLRTPCGSPTYAAPEVFQGFVYDHRIDVWSLGVNLYVLLAAASPWGSSSSNRRQKAKIMAGQYAPLSFISPQAADLLSRMIVVDPAGRLPLDAVLRHPFLSNARDMPPLLRSILQESPEPPTPSESPAGSRKNSVDDTFHLHAVAAAAAAAEAMASPTAVSASVSSGSAPDRPASSQEGGPGGAAASSASSVSASSSAGATFASGGSSGARSAGARSAGAESTDAKSASATSVAAAAAAAAAAAGPAPSAKGSPTHLAGQLSSPAAPSTPLSDPPSAPVPVPAVISPSTAAAAQVAATRSPLNARLRPPAQIDEENDEASGGAIPVSPRMQRVRASAGLFLEVPKPAEKPASAAIDMVIKPVKPRMDLTTFGDGSSFTGSSMADHESLLASTLERNRTHSNTSPITVDALAMTGNSLKMPLSSSSSPKPMRRLTAIDGLGVPSSSSFKDRSIASDRSRESVDGSPKSSPRIARRLTAQDPAAGPSSLPSGSRGPLDGPSLPAHLDVGHGVASPPVPARKSLSYDTRSGSAHPLPSGAPSPTPQAQGTSPTVMGARRATGERGPPPSMHLHLEEMSSSPESRKFTGFGPRRGSGSDTKRPPPRSQSYNANQRSRATSVLDEDPTSIFAHAHAGGSGSAHADSVRSVSPAYQMLRASADPALASPQGSSNSLSVSFPSSSPGGRRMSLKVIREEAAEEIAQVRAPSNYAEKRSKSFNGKLPPIDEQLHRN